MHITAYIAGLACSAGLTCTLAIVAWRRRPARGSRELTGLLVSACAYAAAATIEAAAATSPDKLFWSAVSYLGAATAPVCSLLIALRMAHVGGRWLRAPRVAALFLVPLGSVVMGFTNQWHHWMWKEPTLVHTWAGVTGFYQHGPWYWVHISYSYTVITAGLVVLASSLRGLAHIYARQNTLVLLSILVPFCGNILYVVSPGLTTGMDLAPILFTIAGVLLTIALRRHRLLRLAPIARTALFEHTVDGVVFLTADGRINDINPAALRAFDLAPDVVGEPVRDVLARAPAVLSAVTRPTTASSDLAMDVPLGDGRWCDVRRVPLRGSRAGTMGWLVTFTDATDRHVAAEQRDRLARQQEAALHLESLGVVASGVAHDFNNLLTAIVGHTELMLLDLPPRSAAAESGQEVLAASRRGADLCEQLEAYARARPLQRSVLDVNASVRRGFGGLPADDVVRFEFAADLPPLWLDASLMRQLVQVLGTNAIEAVGGQARAVTVRTRLAHLDRGALASMPLAHDAEPGTFVAIDVADAGPGIVPDHAMRIFEPFFTTKFHGRGLGLSAALGIVQSHGGVLHVASATGKGTTVTAYLPCAVRHEPAETVSS